MTPQEKRDDPLAGVRCQATARSGSRCKKGCAPGLNVCEFHGGGTATAKEAGLRRLRAMVPAAVKNIKRLANQRGDLKVSLAANKDILDRAGLAPLEVVDQNITYRWEDDDDEKPAPSTT